MSEPFLSEIRLFSYDWAPRGWKRCDGELLPINQYQALYALLGTAFGGNGVSDFGLPDLRGRCPLDTMPEAGYYRGAKWGPESVTLTSFDMGTHHHACRAENQIADSVTPDNGNSFAISIDKNDGSPYPAYASSGTLKQLSNNAISSTGSGYPHNNNQPSLVLNFCIAVTGVFPSRN